MHKGTYQIHVKGYLKQHKIIYNHIKTLKKQKECDFVANPLDFESPGVEAARTIRNFVAKAIDFLALNFN